VPAVRAASGPLDGLANVLDDSRGAVEDLAVLEAQNGEARSGEPKVARVITKRRRKVAGAICFDDEPRLPAEEVDDEGAEGLLSAKLRALDLASS